MAEPVTTYGIIALVISGGAMWIREWRRGKTQKSNGEDLEEIKESQKALLETTTLIDKNVGIIQTDMTGMKENCRKTTQRFEKGINDNRKEILELTKDEKRK